MNIDSSLIQAIATVVLVGVTAFYAWMIRRSIKLMEKQVICDIQIANASVYVDCTNPRLTFDLSFDVYNKNCAGGSITSPNLILRYPDGSEEIILHDVIKGKFLDGYKSDIDDTQVIFLKGGERKNNLKRSYYPDSEHRVYEKDNIHLVDFYIEYSDNLDNSYKIKAARKQNPIL
jgi:hypothetical protein